ncbi:hypothetical protein FDG94_gp008 [Pseudomonas phage SM1]|uniref:Uncharacterized protein n=1 Tax=Pseudomonas phage SM1 TaxID=1772332 RepID=A0A0U3DJY4_9CAUD|nr:hypothetical protein FDG94_gp008 [Pseudomonas phage SM1]ALT58001.1 hypothetical protein SM1_08 [Pseudomonas phage SM1]
MTEMTQAQSRNREVFLSTLSAVQELFDQGSASIQVTIVKEDENGNDAEPYTKDVTFRACKLKHLGPLTHLIQGMVSGLGEPEVVKLLEYVSEAQTRQIEQGIDPYKLDTEGLVREAGIVGNLVRQLFTGAADLLPQYVDLFTNLTKEEVEELEFTDVCLVCYGIFARNFSFFTQNGPLLFQAFVAAVGPRMNKAKAKK